MSPPSPFDSNEGKAFTRLVMQVAAEASRCRQQGSTPSLVFSASNAAAVRALEWPLGVPPLCLFTKLHGSHIHAAQT